MRKQPLKNLQGKTQDKKTVAAMYSICTAKHKGNNFFQTELRKDGFYSRLRYFMVSTICRVLNSKFRKLVIDGKVCICERQFFNKDIECTSE